MGLKKCSVPGCKDTKSVRRRFPVHDKEVLSVWLDRIKNPELYGMDLQKLRAKKFICDAHFSPYCKLERSYRLQYQSLPTVNVPGFDGEPNMKNSLLPYYSGRVPLPETITSVEEQLLGITEDDVPLLSGLSATESSEDGTAMQVSEGIATVVVKSSMDIDIPSTLTTISTSTTFPHAAIEQYPTANPVRRLPTKHKRLLAVANVRTLKELTPQSQNLYKLARSLSKRGDYYRRRCHRLQDKMQHLEEYLKTKEFKILQDMNASASSFINSQCRN